MIVRHPAVPKKRVRQQPPRLEVLEQEKAVLAAIAKRDQEWSVAIRESGGSVKP